MKIIDTSSQTRRAWLSGVLLAALLLTAGCLESPAPPSGRLAVTVAPLNLSGITNAVYTLRVTNGSGGNGQVVWEKSGLSSLQYGDGAGSLGYVGTCDATTGVNTVSLTLEALYDVGGLVATGSYMNPTVPTALQREVDCLANTDVPVTFDITLARRAEQGFFDVAVQFSDIFCSAKLDCENPGGADLELLHNASGARDMTVVLGFACTGSITGTPTFLYMDDPVIKCGSPAVEVARVSPTGLGNVDLSAVGNFNGSGYLFGAVVYHGVEGFAGNAYWNVSFGLNDATFGALGACTLTARATASAGAWTQEQAGFPLPAGSVYPVIDWSVTLSDGGVRACHEHQVNVAGSGVATSYLGYLPLLNGFTWGTEPIYMQHRYEPAAHAGAGEILSAGTPICAPGCSHGVCAAGTPSNACNCAGTGYSGTLCETPVCTASCENGGSCTAPDTCACAAGYDGATCANNIDDCAGAPCGVGTCADGVDTYVCTCPDGYYGDGATSCTACTGLTNCASGLTCTSDTTSVCATCVPGYTGADCETEIDECAPAPCLNGGVCTDAIASYSCECIGGYTGSDCEIPPALLAHWTFDEGSGGTAADSTGNGHDASLVGATWTTGVRGAALSFNGAGQYADVGQPMPLALRPTGAFTLEAWVRPAAYSIATGALVGGIVASQWGPAYSCYSMSIDYRTNGANGGTQGGVHFQVGTTSTYWANGAGGTTNVALPLDTWTHVATVAEASGQYKVYFNGVLVANWSPLASIGYSESCRLAFGWNDAGPGSGGARWFAGDIDDVSIYGVARTQAEIQADYAATMPKASCAAWLATGYTTDDVYSVDPDGAAGAGAPFDAYCDMTTDGGGWTLAVDIDGTTNAHGATPGAYGGPLTSTTGAAKLSDATINLLTTVGYWRYNCGASYNAFVMNDAGVWLSQLSNAYNWRIDRGRDGSFEYAADRAGYVFSDYVAAPTGHSNYAATSSTEGNGCFVDGEGWGRSGNLWVK